MATARGRNHLTVMDQRTYPPKAWSRRRLLQRLSVPLAKGVMLTAGVALFVGVPVAALAFVAMFGHLPGFWYGLGLGLLASFAVFWAWVFLYDD